MSGAGAGGNQEQPRRLLVIHNPTAGRRAAKKLAAWRKALADGLVVSGERVLLFNCANGNKYPLPDRSKQLKLEEAVAGAL